MDVEGQPSAPMVPAAPAGAASSSTAGVVGGSAVGGLLGAPGGVSSSSGGMNEMMFAPPPVAVTLPPPVDFGDVAEQVGKKARVLMVELPQQTPHDVETTDVAARDDGMDPAAVAKGKAEELQAMLDFGVYKEISKDEIGHQKVVGTRWVLTQKPDKVRARLVATEVAYEKREDLYSPTPTAVGLRCVLAKAVAEGSFVQVADLTTAFLHAPCQDSVVVRPPAEFGKPGVFWQLQKAMYGTRAAPRDFSDYLAHELVKLGFARLKSDGSVFSNHKTGVDISVHVDDPLVAGPSEEAVESLFSSLEHVVKLKRGPRLLIGGPEVTYLGKRYRRTHDSIIIMSGKGYVEQTLKAASMEASRAMSTPGTTAARQEKATLMPEENPELSAEEARQFRSTLGRIMFMQAERCDMQFAMKELARAMARPTCHDQLLLKRTLRYLQGTPEHGTELSLDKMPAYLDVWVDSDWGGCPVTRRSTSGWAVRLMCSDGERGFNLSCGSRTQSVVAQSSCESEYYAVYAGLSEALLAQNVLSELGVPVKIRVHCDSSACRSMLARTGLGRMKHMELKWLWCQDLHRKKVFTMHKVESARNTSDIFTKHLDSTLFHQHATTLGIANRGP